VTDGCPGLAAAIQMRNIVETVRKRDYDQVNSDARAIYLAPNRWAARDAFRRFQKRGRPHYPNRVRQLERDLPELLGFFSFPEHLWRRLRTRNVIERVFRGGPAAYPADGLFRQCGQRRPNHLPDLSQVQFGAAQPHPPGSYTSRLTSPSETTPLTPARIGRKMSAE
jgi:hypothetical protein